MASGEWRVAVAHQAITDLEQSAARTRYQTLLCLRIASSGIGLPKGHLRQFRPSWVNHLKMWMRSLDDTTSGERKVALSPRVITDLEQSAARIRFQTLPCPGIGS